MSRQCLGKRSGPVIASTDYMKAYADQIRAFVPKRYKVLGTDGFGRSDTRKKLRRFFEVDRYYIAVAALKALADEGTIAASEVSAAIKLYKHQSRQTESDNRISGGRKKWQK